MKKNSLISILLFAAVAVFAQVPPYVHNQWDTNDQSVLPTPASVITTNQFTSFFYPEAFGAKRNGTKLYDVSVQPASAVISSASAKFTSADVGKVAWLFQDTTNLTYLLTSISSFQNSTQVTLAANSPVGWTNNGNFTYGSDDTVPIQSAVNAAYAAGGGVVQLQPGMYVVAGSFINRQATTAYNESSVITLPCKFIRDSSTNKTVTVLVTGYTPGAHGVSVDTNFPTLSGTIIYCPSRPTVADSGTNFNCIFGANSPTNDYALEQYWFKNLTMRKPRNAQFHGIASVWGGGLGVEDVGIDVDYPAGDQYRNPPNYISIFIPTNSVQNAYTDTAIWTPGLNNDSNTKINRVFTYGWGCGIEAGEHVQLNDSEFEYGGTGISLFTSTGFAQHNASGAYFNGIHLIGNTIQLACFTNAYESAFTLIGATFENKTNTTTELYDSTGGVLRGSIYGYQDIAPFDAGGLNYNSTNISWFFMGNAGTSPYPKTYLAGDTFINNLVEKIYYTNIISDFLVTSNFFNSGTGATGFTNSPASMMLPAGKYKFEFLGFSTPSSGSDSMLCGLNFSTTANCNYWYLSGAANTSPNCAYSQNLSATKVIFGFNATLATAGYSATGTISFTSGTTVSLAAMHGVFTTNSFNFKQGSYMKFERITQ